MASRVRTWGAATAPAPTIPIRTLVGIPAGYGEPDGPAATRPSAGASGSLLSRFGPLQRASQEIRVADIDAFVHAEADALVAELSEWCAIPSVSSDPERAADVRRSAEHLAGLMEAAGLDTEGLAAAGGQPAVYGEWLGAGAEAPTITVYGHHDVQPADPLEEWTTPPFEPTVRHGYLP